MTADSQKKSHPHHYHHHQHPHKKMVHIKSLERLTNLPVVESAHAYYEKIKNSNTLIKWSLMPAETGMWLAVGTAMPVVSYFEKPVTAMDSIFCMGLDVLEANLPMIKYPPDLVYNITKDYLSSKVVTPVMKRADSVKQLSINGANNFGELAANRLNSAIDVADKYVDKYLPDISDAPDSTTEESGGEQDSLKTNQPFTKDKIVEDKTSRRFINRLHVYSDSHGKYLTDKLKKRFSIITEIHVSVTFGASSTYIVENAIQGLKQFGDNDVAVLIAGLEDVALGKNAEDVYYNYLENVRTFVIEAASTHTVICPILPQFDLPRDGVVNKTINKINRELRLRFAKLENVAVLDLRPLKRRNFTKSGLYLTGKGKSILAYTIASTAKHLINKKITNDGPNPGSNAHSNSKRSKTIQHVNQFSRKLQRRLTRRTIAEARALKQQGADTLRSFVYLVNLLASDPKLFMEKARAMWLELSKDEPENQVPPANLEQLIEMLLREFARRVVHLTNYSYVKMIVFTHHGMEAAHIAACAAIYWANQVIKAMHLEPAIEKTITQIVRAHHASIEFVEKLVELIRNLKIEGLKVAEKRAILPTEQPPQPSQSTDSVTPQRTSSVSSVSSVTSYVSTASSNTITPSKPSHPSLNGETYTVYESKHEQVVS